MLTSSRCGDIIKSDHSPVEMSLQFQENESVNRLWRLNLRLLNNEDFVSFIFNQIDFFLETNQTSCTTV